MEMEELNKSQIILLTLLVSFVTSLATGIVTVSLMEQGVTPVTNTVNKIVERTKETIVKVTEPQKPVIITETKEVIVHQADLVAGAVAKNKNTSLILYKVVPVIPQEVALGTSTTTSTIEDAAATTTPSIENSDSLANAVTAMTETEIPTESTSETELVFASRVIVLNATTVIADASAIEAEAQYVILTKSGERTEAIVGASHNGITEFTVSAGVPADTQAATVERGQSIIVLTGKGRLRVVTGIISDIIMEGGSIMTIEIDKAVMTPGSMLINTNGVLIGMSTGQSRTNGATWFSPQDTLTSK